MSPISTNKIEPPTIIEDAEPDADHDNELEAQKKQETFVEARLGGFAKLSCRVLSLGARPKITWRRADSSLALPAVSKQHTFELGGGVFKAELSFSSLSEESFGSYVVSGEPKPMHTAKQPN